METIKSNKEIDLIFKNGDKINLPFLSLILYEDKKEQINGKVAFLAGKKNGNAVWRNKSKRKLREIYKNLNFDKEDKILLIANKNLNDYTNTKFFKRFFCILRTSWSKSTTSRKHRGDTCLIKTNQHQA